VINLPFNLKFESFSIDTGPLRVTEAREVELKELDTERFTAVDDPVRIAASRVLFVNMFVVFAPIKESDVPRVGAEAKLAVPLDERVPDTERFTAVDDPVRAAASRVLFFKVFVVFAPIKVSDVPRVGAESKLAVPLDESVPDTERFTADDDPVRTAALSVLFFKVFVVFAPIKVSVPARVGALVKLAVPFEVKEVDMTMVSIFVVPVSFVLFKVFVISLTSAN